MTSLHKVYFSTPPHWVKPVGSISTHYSSLTFAFSNPDGSIAKALMTNQQALFGKRVTIERAQHLLSDMLPPP
ncbi:hypothetical protein BJV74DRAFT_886250 [Russula compacta]|nr:hypothetical protein BJV74DRAFT_886250 [Russula compacta]